jgi:hypothetical protein
MRADVSIGAAVLIGVSLVSTIGCAGEPETTPVDLQQGADPPPIADAGTLPQDARPPPDAKPSTPDNAEIVSASLPDSLKCGETRTVTIAVRNTGSASWTASAYALGAVSATDPLSAVARVALAPTETIATGATKSFNLDLKAPSVAGSYTTGWQMVHDKSRFGGIASHAVTVACPIPDGEAALASAGIYNSPPDIASWPVTTKITRLEFSAKGLGFDFSKKDGPDRWPDVTPPGWDGPIQYTVWLLLNVNGQWTASGIIQYWYGLQYSGGDVTANNQIAVNWVYDGRWGPMAHHQPAPGEYVGFMVMAGNARGVTDASQAPARERSNVVVVPFPAAAGPVFNF